MNSSLDSYFANSWPEVEFGELVEILSAACFSYPRLTFLITPKLGIHANGS